MVVHEEPLEGTGEHPGFVAVVFARSTSDAERYRELLADHDVNVFVGTDEELDDKLIRRLGRTHGVPVLVPADQADEARTIIADWHEFSDFQNGDDDLDDEDDDDRFALSSRPNADADLYEDGDADDDEDDYLSEDDDDWQDDEDEQELDDLNEFDEDEFDDESEEL